jgi:hypothetical protein
MSPGEEDFRAGRRNRVGGGPYGPQPPTPPYVPFGIRRFMQDLQGVDILQEGL